MPDPGYLSQRPPAWRVAWISGRRPEKQMHVSALIIAVVTGCRAPGLKTTNQFYFFINIINDPERSNANPI
jgi:hypothetical protein